MVSLLHIFSYDLILEPVCYFVVALRTFTNLIGQGKPGFKFLDAPVSYHVLNVLAAGDQGFLVVNRDLILETAGKFHIFIFNLVLQISFGHLLHFFHLK